MKLAGLHIILKYIILLGIMPMVFAQYPVVNTPSTPKTHSMQVVTPTFNRGTASQGFPASKSYSTQQQQNQKLIDEVEQHQKEQEERQKRAQTLINEAVSHFSTPYILPSYSNEKGTDRYRKAYTALGAMEKKPFSVKEAVFTVENAFYEKETGYDEFNKVIQQTGDFIKEKMQEFGYDTNSNVAKNLMLFQFFSDTLKTKNELTHLPLAYDFDDIWGKKDWSNMFVTKLLESGKGQCHSLPLLYLMLAEEIDATAHLSRSPNHTYIKFPDDNGMKWHNVELTSQILTTNALILQNGYIKAEAIQNKLYMHPLSQQELLSQMYADLAMGYQKKFGHDRFTKEALQKALELDTNNITALLTQANYYTEMVVHVFTQLGITQENIQQELPKHSKALALFQKMVHQHKTIDAIGYKKMPDAIYQKWLATMQKQKDNQQQKAMKEQLHKLTKSLPKL
ncbi:hypothetical protein U6A24_18205 [Aquimarina gracilis]|uniref:Transglutaminase superfamily protein n=1 Tax=Aquimarina gracilis TaxID=874422 RepID=A0ABU5ZZV9_9FLAO|nr:hypothetical protein [Aquimarina gracilis]MEB3347414.1 hypothetical protein [Aquimarina gracilis]